jgi:hypothetical protein
MSAGTASGIVDIASGPWIDAIAGGGRWTEKEETDSGRKRVRRAGGRTVPPKRIDVALGPKRITALQQIRW